MDVVRRRAGAALVALWLLVPSAAARGEDVDPAAREWTQTRGNASRQGASAVEPLAGQPVDAWTQKLPGRPLAEPVTWGGVVFVAAENGKSRELRAFRAATGEALGATDLGAGGRLALASWQGAVVVGEAKQLRAFKHDGAKFAAAWSKSGSFGASPCVYRGYCFVADGAELACFDVARGGSKVAKTPAAVAIEETKGLKEPPVGGAVGVYQNKSDGALYAAVVSTAGANVLISRTRIDDLGVAGKMQMHFTVTFKLGEFTAPAGEAERWEMIPCRVDGGGTAKSPGAWIVLSPSREFKGGGTGKFVSDTADPSGLNLVTAPAVLDGTAYSFTQSGALQSWRANGETETLIGAGAAPPGTRQGPATRAGGVVFLGNWAVETASRRVIWNVAHEPVTPAVPVGDKRLCFATKDELICIADASIASAPPTPTPPAAAPGAAGAPPSSGTTADAPTSTKPPVDMDGVLLDDGRQIEGTFEQTVKGRMTIHPKDGGPALDVSIGSVVVAEKAGAAEYRGDDAAASVVWRAAVRSSYCAAMEEVFKEYAKAGLVDQARAAMQRMRENGAAEARLTRLDASLNGKTPRTDASRAKKLAAQEDAAKAALVDGLGGAVEWCGKRGFVAAATVALNEIERLDGRRAADVAKRADALVPPGFFYKDSTEPTKQWRRWAEALLPSSAEFVEPGDAAWSRLDNKPWNDGATLCFRTRNVLMYIREQDPVVVGKALRLAEGAVRALQAFLKNGEVDDVTSDEDRLEIRIHKSRADYLAEDSPHGKAESWTAGFFSPSEKISHFYVDRDRTRDGSVDIEELTRVLTHEFTHHYMSVRWMANKGSGGGAGFWVVEGMAEFIQEQAHRMDQRGLKFDDDAVPGVDAAAQAAKQGVLWKADKFLDMSQGDFSQLHDDFGFCHVKLRNSFKEQSFSERALWYAQAGALSYFCMQKKGLEFRRRFVGYVRSQYLGGAPRPGYAALGYETAEELDKEFLAFLKTVGG